MLNQRALSQFCTTDHCVLDTHRLKHLYFSKCTDFYQMFKWHFIPKAEGKLRGQQDTGKDTLCALQGFPICLPWSSFCVTLSFVTEIKRIRLWESKTGKEPGLWRNIHFKHIFLQEHRRESETKADFFFWNFILLWKPLFKKSVLGYTYGAGKRVWTYCFLLPLTASFSVIE